MTRGASMKSLLALTCLTILPPAAVAQSAKIEAVVNAASFESGLPHGGALATVFVSGLNVSQPPPVITYHPGTYIATALPLPQTLGGVSVSVCEFVAPLLAAVLPPIGSTDYVQINFQVPLERNVPLLNQTSCNFDIYLGDGIVAETRPLPPAPTWGSFFRNAKGYVVAQHASDYSLVTSDNPAHAGEAIIAYANDFFYVWPPPGVGLPAPLQPLVGMNPGTFRAGLYLQSYPPLTPPTPILGTCGGYFPNTPAVPTTFFGLAPGQLGVEQINFNVPADQQPGDWDLFFALNGSASKQGVLLPVR